MDVKNKILELIKTNNIDQINEFYKTEKGMFFIDKFYIQIISLSLQYDYQNIIIGLYNLLLPPFKKEIFMYILQSCNKPDLLTTLYSIHNITFDENMIYYSPNKEIVFQLFHDQITLHHIIRYITITKPNVPKCLSFLLQFKEKLLSNFDQCYENYEGKLFVKIYLQSIIDYCLLNDSELLIAVYRSNCDIQIKNNIFEQTIGSNKTNKLNILDYLIHFHKPPFSKEFMNYCVLTDEIIWLIKHYYDDIRMSDYISYCIQYGSLIQIDVLKYIFGKYIIYSKTLEKFYNIFCCHGNFNCAFYIYNYNKDNIKKYEKMIQITDNVIKLLIQNVNIPEYQKLIFWLIETQQIKIITPFIISSNNPINFIKKQIEVNEPTYCSICLGETNEEHLHFIKLDCECKDKQYIHIECLCTWLKQTNKNECIYCFKPIDWSKCCKVML
jgi:hypothetical protein